MLACGIDPGRDKFGIALTEGTKLLFSAVVPIGFMDTALESVCTGNWEALSAWLQEGAPASGIPGLVCLGNGTGSQIFEKKLIEKSINYCMIDERMTTLEGRKLYWRLHPPKGLWRIVPLSLRTPPRPVDDLAAWAIASRAAENG